MNDKMENTARALGLLAKWRTTKWVIPGGALLIVSLLLAYCQTLERPFLDRFDEYDVKNSVVDQGTGKVIELGHLYNFGSEGYEVGIYDALNPNRTSAELTKPLFSISSPFPIPEKIEYDGACYFIRTELRKDWTDVSSSWTDPKTGKSLCFYLLTPTGERIENYQS